MKPAHHDKKLGRGLSALLGESKSKANENFVLENSSAKKEVVEIIPVNKITAGIYQPRRNFKESEIQELAESIRENGLIQPILLRKNDDEGHFEIIAGERRFRAVKALGLKEIPAIVRKINNHEALELALIENVQRENLSITEEAAGYKQLMNEFSYTQDQVAKKTGKSRPHIANILRILDLPKEVHELLDNKLISMGHARAIVNSKNPEALARKIITDAMTVRDVEDVVRDEKVENLRKNPVVARKESRIKFVNSGELTDMENRFSELLESPVKISFNQFKNNGKLTIQFDDLEKIYGLLMKLES